MRGGLYTFVFTAEVDLEILYNNNDVRFFSKIQSLERIPRSLDPVSNTTVTF